MIMCILNNIFDIDGWVSVTWHGEETVLPLYFLIVTKIKLCARLIYYKVEIIKLLD